MTARRLDADRFAVDRVAFPVRLQARIIRPNEFRSRGPTARPRSLPSADAQHPRSGPLEKRPREKVSRDDGLVAANRRTTVLEGECENTCRVGEPCRVCA
jgi:hypothetical protein